MENYFTKIEVGKSFDLFRNRVYSDCCLMEITNDGMFVLCIFLKNMSNKEKKLLKEGDINVRIVENGELIYPIIQFNNTDFAFEIDFNPFLYKDKRKKLSGKSNLVNIIGVELLDYSVQTIRLANMPKKLYSKYITSWNTNTPIDFNVRYTKWVNELQRKYSVLDLWDRGIYIGKFGEK